MVNYTTSEEYIHRFDIDLNRLESNHCLLYQYFHQQVALLDQLLGQLTKENFWVLIPSILGIDSKLVLLNELIVSFEDFDFSDAEIKAMIEEDYVNYNKELCGYNLGEATQHSLIFNVE